MSHVATIDLHITDLESLAKACPELGLEFCESKSTYKWFGKSVGDYPLPAGFKASDLGKCEHAIRVTGNKKAYEVGICKQRDGKHGYTLLWDFWRGGYGLKDKIGLEAGLLKQAYAAQVACKQLRKQGLRVTVNKQANGTMKIVAKH